MRQGWLALLGGGAEREKTAVGLLDVVHRANGLVVTLALCACDEPHDRDVPDRLPVRVEVHEAVRELDPHLRELPTQPGSAVGDVAVHVLDRCQESLCGVVVADHLGGLAREAGEGRKRPTVRRQVRLQHPGRGPAGSQEVDATPSSFEPRFDCGGLRPRCSVPRGRAAARDRRGARGDRREQRSGRRSQSTKAATPSGDRASTSARRRDPDVRRHGRHAHTCRRVRRTRPRTRRPVAIPMADRRPEPQRAASRASGRRTLRALPRAAGRRV